MFAVPIERPWGRHFGARIMQRRKMLGLTRAELGARANLSAANIERLEEGRIEPCLSTVIAIAKALSMSSGELFPNIDPDIRTVLADLFGGLPPPDPPPSPAAPGVRVPAQFGLPFARLDDRCQVLPWPPRRRVA